MYMYSGKSINAFEIKSIDYLIIYQTSIFSLFFNNFIVLTILGKAYHRVDRHLVTLTTGRIRQCRIFRSLCLSQALALICPDALFHTHQLITAPRNAASPSSPHRPQDYFNYFHCQINLLNFNIVLINDSFKIFILL